jgi:hypothetical protein
MMKILEFVDYLDNFDGDTGFIKKLKGYSIGRPFFWTVLYSDDTYDYGVKEGFKYPNAQAYIYIAYHREYDIYLEDSNVTSYFIRKLIYEDSDKRPSYSFLTNRYNETMYELGLSKSLALYFPDDSVKTKIVRFSRLSDFKGNLIFGSHIEYRKMYFYLMEDEQGNFWVGNKDPLDSKHYFIKSGGVEYDKM